MPVQEKEKRNWDVLGGSRRGGATAEDLDRSDMPGGNDMASAAATAGAVGGEVSRMDAEDEDEVDLIDDELVSVLGGLRGDGGVMWWSDVAVMALVLMTSMMVRMLHVLLPSLPCCAYRHKPSGSCG